MHARSRVLSCLFAAACSVSAAHATTITRVVSFTNTSGWKPAAPLLQASDGNFYGTTSTGGDDGNNCAQACSGTVFKLTPGGQFTRLFTFAYGSQAAPFENGRTPLGGLVEGPDGWLYGTTNSGGYQFNSYGVVYRISKSGQFQKIHDFCPTSPCPDGANPVGELVFGRDGWLYGVTQSPIIAPRIFKISTTGSYAVVANFLNLGIGTPQNGLVLGSDGNFYGETNLAIFRVTPAGGVTNLHSFTGGDGVSGNGPLIQATDGYLYGVCFQGGANGAGTVFRIALDGSGFQKIHDLLPANEGAYANGVIQASNGLLWGTTSNNSSSLSGGTVYEITRGGSFLEGTFLTADNGKASQAHLIQASDGRLYGTASQAGPDSGGTVFVVDAGLPAPQPAEAAPGSTPMTVSAFDKATGDITLSYGGACYAPDHHIVYGPLSGVATYQYTGQVCNVRNYGSATFNPGPGNIFWFLVGNTVTVEGSYGTGPGGVERPEAAGLVGCDYPQVLGASCP